MVDRGGKGNGSFWHFRIPSQSDILLYVVGRSIHRPDHPILLVSFECISFAVYKDCPLSTYIGIGKVKQIKFQLFVGERRIRKTPFPTQTLASHLSLSCLPSLRIFCTFGLGLKPVREGKPGSEDLS